MTLTLNQVCMVQSSTYLNYTLAHQLQSYYPLLHAWLSRLHRGMLQKIGKNMRVGKLVKKVYLNT